MYIKTAQSRNSRRKAAIQRILEGAPLHSFRTLLTDWATIA